MRYYKVLKDGKTIDVLSDCEIVFLNYQERHGRMQFCEESDAQAIFSSDRKHIWHESSLYELPIDGYETVTLEEIDEYEYNQLKIFNCKSIDELIDRYTLLLIENKVI